MKNFYLKLQEILFSPEAETAFKNKGVKPVSEIDFFKRQYSFQESFDLMNLPSVFVEISIDYENQNKPGNMEIILHCCYQITEKSSGVRKTSKVNSLKFIDFYEMVFNLVKNLESEDTGKLTLTSENTGDSNGIVYVYLFTFRCSYTGRHTPIQDQFDNIEEIDGDTGTEVSTTGYIKKYDFS